MKISGTTTFYAGSKIGGNKKDTVIENIQSQIKKIQEDIAKLSENKTMTDKEKVTKKQEMEKQIAELNNQLIQRQMEQKKLDSENQTNEVEKSVSKNQRDKNDIGISNKSMEAMISASTSIDKAKTINHVRTQMDGNAHVLKGEIAVAKSRGGNLKDLKLQLGELEAKIGDITKDGIKEYSDANEDMEISQKSDIEQAKNEDTNEKKENEKKIDVYA